MIRKIWKRNKTTSHLIANLSFGHNNTVASIIFHCLLANGAGPRL